MQWVVERTCNSPSFSPHRIDLSKALIRALHRRLMAGNDELDPQLWSELPKEILEEHILTKLPFLDLVKLRAVSKLWRSEVIPATAQVVQAGSRAVLLYFSIPQLNLEKGDAWCSRFCNVKKDQTDGKLSRCYLPKHFPDYWVNALLMACEKGLLFHAIITDMYDPVIPYDVVLAIVVLNPLTGKSKELRLPKPLLHVGACGDLDIILVGVVVDAVTGNYKLVVSGFELKGQCKMFLYDSSLDAWTDGPSFLPVIPRTHTPSNVRNLKFSSRQAICVNDNFYWSCTWVPRFHRREGNYLFVLKLDMQKMTWSSIPVGLDFVGCCVSMRNRVQIAAYRDQVLMWHAHGHSGNHGNHVEFAGGGDNEGEDHRGRRCKVSVRKSDLDSDPHLKLMPQDMIHTMNEFVKTCEDKKQHYMAVRHPRSRACKDYRTFSRGDFFYHIIHVVDGDGEDSFMRILVYNTEENFFTELPTIKVSRIFEDKRKFCLSDTWSFSASLISRP